RRLLRRSSQADPQKQAVLAVGPGMGRGEAINRRVHALLQQPRRIVLDADGLNALAASGKPRPLAGENSPPLVMTPHPGEFARLCEPLGIEVRCEGDEERLQAAGQLAQVHRAIVVLKGHRTVVTDGSRGYINTTGNPALATAGSGDVLTGLIAGLLAQGMSPFEATVLGVYLHGLAGDLWANQFGPVGLTATGLLDLLPKTLACHQGRIERTPPGS
ncbi:MAG: NAD(P)H-hydrate dehydratase, partial [Phycisphaerales bacterium]|nr:NAD(P)H-hydrate dehydratase [Phycisphaerales bacterium]